MLFALLAAAACGEDGAPVPPPPAWACPSGWVPLEAGGCGPPAVACAPDSPAPGHCDGVPLGLPGDGAPPPAGLALDADGEVVGLWPADGWEPPGLAGRPAIDACPDGWAPTADGACDPRLPLACPDGSAPLPGLSCVALEPCPEGPFPDAPPGSTALHVLAGADPALADGSADHPYATVTAAVAAAPPGATLLLGPGVYDGPVIVDHDLTLVGLCAPRVKLDGAIGEPAVAVVGSQVHLERLSLVTPLGDGVQARDGARVTLRGMVVRAMGYDAVRASGVGTRVDITDLVVDGTGAPGIDSSAIVAEDGAEVVGARIAAGHLTQVGIGARGEGTVVDVSDLRVHDVSGSGVASGIVARQGARLVVRRGVVEGHRGAGITAFDGRGTLLVAEDVILSGLLEDGAPGVGSGVSARQGASVDLSRVLVDQVRGPGVSAEGAQSLVTLADTMVRGSRPWQTADGLRAIDGGSILAERVALVGNARYGASASGASSRLQLEDARLSGNGCVDGMGYGAGGVSVREGAEGTLRRLLLRGNGGPGFLVYGLDAHATLEEAVVEDPIACHYETVGVDLGQGLYVGLGRLAADRVRIERPVTAGVDVESGRLDLTDVLVRDVREGAADFLGAGGVAQGATLTATRVLVDGAGEAGFAANLAARLVLTDVLVRDIRPSPRGFGMGVLMSTVTEAQLERVAVVDTFGAAIAAISGEQLGLSAVGEARVVGHDVLVARVHSSPVRSDVDGSGTPEGLSVAYGLHTGKTGTIDLARVVVAGGGYGLYAAAGTRGLTLSEAVVTGQLDAAGAAAEPGRLDLDRVTFRLNRADEVVRDASLPEASALPPPTPVCADGC